MSTVNLGAQTITFDYKEPAKSVDFNELLRDLLRPGVYKGGNLSITKTFTVDGNNEISIDPFHLFLNTDYTEASILYNLAIHASTRSNILIDPGTQTGGERYIFVGYTHIKTIENWLDFRVDNSITPLTNEIIIGTITYNGVGDVTAITDANRTYGGLYTIDSQTYKHVNYGDSGIMNDGNLGIGTLSDFGTGKKVIAITDSSQVPSTNPASGGILYAEGGELKWRKANGTIVTLSHA